MRRISIAVALAASMCIPPTRAPAQVLPAVTGAAGGAVAGLVVTLGVVVARATFQSHYLESVGELVGVTGSPMIVLPAAGLALGWGDGDLLAATGVGAAVGLALGAVGGAALGALLSRRPEAPWAGGEMGAAVGLLTGALVAGILHATAEDGDTGPNARSGVPVGIRLRF